jgi:hypothetical protein
MKAKTKRFDCVEMKHAAQGIIEAETRGMSAADKAAYFARRAAQGPFAGWWRRVTRSPAARRRLSPA